MIVCLLVGKKCPTTNVPLGHSQIPSSPPWAQSLPSSSPVRVDLWAGVVCHVWVAPGATGVPVEVSTQPRTLEDLGSSWLLPGKWGPGRRRL